MNDDNLFLVLLDWQRRGFHPELHSATNGQWVLVLSTDHWSKRDPDQMSTHMGFRYNSDPCPTPQESIRATMEVFR